LPIKKLNLNLIGKVKRPEFQIRRKMLSKIIEGELTANSKGRGIEFTGFRKYVYGDDASMIDWTASLRSKDILIREYEEFKHFPIYILLDVSNSMLFSSTEKLKCEYAAEMAFSIVYSIVNTGNKVGLGMFNNRLRSKNLPDNGTKNYYDIVQRLTKPENYGGKFDLKKTLMQTKNLLGEKSMIIIISDFIGLEKGWDRYLKMLSEKFDILGIMVRDPRDRELPSDAGQFLVEDPYTKEKLLIDAKDYAKIYKKQVEKEEQEIKEKFQVTKAGFFSVSTTEDFLKPLMKYTRMRGKALLNMRD
jgi:uncharacterized protein (DUF58 family)